MVVTLNLSGSYNGDIYAYLSHGSGFSVLLNRTGRGAGNSLAMAMTDLPSPWTTLPLLATFTPIATPSRRVLALPLQGRGSLTDTARIPNLVTDLSLRNALLGSFNFLDANGDWTLFVADMSTGDAHTLQSWSMTITGIPEPSQAVLSAGALLLLNLRRRRAPSFSQRFAALRQAAQRAEREAGGIRHQQRLENAKARHPSRRCDAMAFPRASEPEFGKLLQTGGCRIDHNPSSPLSIVCAAESGVHEPAAGLGAVKAV